METALSEDSRKSLKDYDWNTNLSLPSRIHLFVTSASTALGSPIEEAAIDCCLLPAVPAIHNSKAKSTLLAFPLRIFDCLSQEFQGCFDPERRA
jgi:hypothetical protein